MSVVAEYTPPIDLDLEHKPRFVDSLAVNASYEIETQESYGLHDGCTHAVEVTTNRNRTHPTWRPSDLPKCREMWIGKNAVEVLTDSFEAYRYRPEILHLWCSEEELNVIKGELGKDYDLSKMAPLEWFVAELKRKPKPVEVPVAEGDKAELMIRMAEHMARLKRAFALDDAGLARVVAQLDGVVVP